MCFLLKQKEVFRQLVRERERERQRERDRERERETEIDSLIYAGTVMTV